MWYTFKNLYIFYYKWILMFHKIKNVKAYPDYKILVQFSEGITKIYNVEKLIEKNVKFYWQK